MNAPLIPIILAGGAGQRLWPLSRTTHPKPFLTLPQGGTLLGKTVARAATLPNVPAILTVVSEELLPTTRMLVEEALNHDALKAPGRTAIRAGFMTEPCGRNTAPAIAMATLWVRQHHGDDAILLVLPADHLIENQTAFAAAVQRARQLAAQGRLTTFGIAPTRIETGFGHIERGNALPNNEPPADARSASDLPPAFAIARFIEKPPAEEAARLIATQRVYWNAGMFCLKADTVAAAFQQHAASLWQTAEMIHGQIEAAHPAQENIHRLPPAFADMPDTAFDRAIMERCDTAQSAAQGAMVAGTFDWNDIGSWIAWTDLTPTDSDGNRLHGDTLALASQHTRVYAESRLVAALGVQNLIIAETADAVLVAHRDHVQDVRAITAQLAARGDASCHTPNTVRRPWGRYTVLQESPGVKIKEIEVAPGARLSLQRHRFRSEHWVVTQGTARVTRGDETFLIEHNESTFIPVGVKHRLENPGDAPLTIIEVQCGSYVGEDDIERFDDVYGRIRHPDSA